MSQIVPTGIPALDKLLGGGIRRKSVVVLRGGPGSGKTTLAVQIMNNIICKENGMALFISLETDPQKIIDYANTHFGTKINTTNDFLPIDGKRLTADLNNYCKKLIFFKKLQDAPSNLIKNYISRAENWHFQNADIMNQPKLIVIDSLNVLCALIQQVNRKNVMDMRSICHELAYAAQENLRDAIVLFTGEYDIESPYGESLFGESFLCDVEIVLTQEDVPTRLSKVDQTGSEEAKRTPAQKRFFCRVHKAREMPRQTRRCSYDFVEKHGIIFYETYPGDGNVVLFQENAPMRQEWETFRNRDIPDLYPTLSFEEFDRSGLQRAFASQRRQWNIPQRMDMYLTSFDTYWINWYAEFCQRSQIALIGRKLLDCAAENATMVKQKLFSGVIGKIHRQCTDMLKKIAEFAKNLNLDIKETPLLDNNDLLHRAKESFPSEIGTLVNQIDIDDGESITTIELKKAIYIDDFENLAIDVVSLLKLVKWNIEVIKISSEETYDRICKGKCDGNCSEKIKENILESLKTYDGSGLLAPIRSNRLRLFGERRSHVIKELEELDMREGRPYFRPFGIPCSTELLAVPYHANVGFIVVNGDMFDIIFKEKIKNISPENLKTALLEEHKKLCGINLDNPNELDACVTKRAEALKNGELPETWEEFILLCHYFKELGQNPANPINGHGYPFLIETLNTIDTFLATFLEIFWSFGSILDIHPDYEVEGFNEGNPLVELPEGETPIEKKLFWALDLIKRFFNEGLTPPNSSLDVSFLLRRAKQIEDKKPVNEENIHKYSLATSWLFARQWYSTFVDALTYVANPKETRTEFSLGVTHLGTNLKIMQIPITMNYYAEQIKEWNKANPGHDLNQFKPAHHSCLGEWYFAVLKGTENMALAEDLINNLMSSHKVWERVSQCAAVPAKEEFYTMYKNVRCFNLPAREGEIQLPPETWLEFREKFLKNVKSRTVIFDYRHSIREIHAVLEYIRTYPAGTDIELKNEIRNALIRIQELAQKQILFVQ